MLPENLKSKYVVILVQGLEVPVLLPLNAGIAHAAAAKVGHPIAAGECLCHYLGEGALGFTVSGESVSLDIKNRGQKDVKLLDFYFLQGGVK